MSMERHNTKQKHYSSKELAMYDPEERLKLLGTQSESVDIDPTRPIIRYYRTGYEMVRQADVYLEEGSVEKAYILYMKFLILFMEKIKNHPEYNSASPKDKFRNHQMSKDVLPKTEALKKQLKNQYDIEFKKYIKEVKEKERIDLERMKEEHQLRLKEEEERKNRLAANAAANVTKAAIKAAAISSPFDDSKGPKPMHVTNIPVSYPPINNIGQSSKEKDNSRTKTPAFDRSTKPNLQSNDSQLRDVLLPNALIRDFLKLSSSNTTNNKETCGILAGRLERNRLRVTHLLIPKQTGTSDSCATHNEEDFFDYQDAHNLITLGWIHTHPTQTAFLSSVDLHTHCAYQLMMAEAIAIVCAPKYDETGFFVLTPEYGLNFIANCRETGFHPHPSSPPLFTKANHVKLDDSAPIVVVDLRNK